MIDHARDRLMLLLTCFVFFQCVATTRCDADQPNVLLIAVDDLNDWVGCLGVHPQTKTPNIDSLAHDGVLFTNAHCQGPICGPSRASLLSGKYPHQTGVYQQPTGKSMENDRKNFRGRMLTEYFASHGYKTMGVGKIAHGYSDKIAFDQYGGKFDGSGPKPQERFHYHLPDVPYSGTQTDWGAFPDVDEKMPDHRSADWAIDRLSQPHEKPFFLAVGFIRPHVPFYVPEKWFAPFPLDSIVLPPVRDDDLEDVPLIGRQVHEMPKYPSLEYLQANNDKQFRLCVQAYMACIHFVDHQIGRVIKALDSSDYAENTVVVLFSDHGYHIGEKDRVSKHSLWDEGTRVPMIIRRPTDGSTAYGTARRCDRPVGLIDLYPTLIELCGLPKNAGNSGKSMVPLLDDPGAQFRDAILTTYARGNHALRDERYRYIRYDDGSEELYDHKTDPNEWTNLSSDSSHRDRIMRFRKLLPTDEVPYHEATSGSPVNRWFAEHLEKNGIRKKPK